MKNNKVENPLYKYKKLIFIFLIIFLTVIVTISNKENIEEALFEVINIKFNSLILLIILLVIYLVCDALILKVCIDDKKINFVKAFVINMAGCFFSSITPMYSGSYPSRIYYLYKEDISIESSLSALTVKGITYQLLISIIAVVSLFVIGPSVIKEGGYITLLIIGFIYNIAITLVVILISGSKKINLFALKLIKIVTSKLKNLRKKQDDIISSVSNYYDRTQRMYGDRIYFLKVSLYTLIKLFVYNLIPVVVFYGLGIDISKYYLEIFGLSSLTGIIVSVFPTPGGMLASEAVFLIFFKLLFNLDSTVEAGLLIWRLFTYYIIIILGLIATLFLQAKEPKKVKGKKFNV